MPYSVTYPDTCTGTIPLHYCDPCSDVEQARVRSVAFINTSFYDTLIASPTDTNVWEDGIDDSLIFIIPETNGSFDGGTPVEGPGFGSSPTKFMGSDFVLNYKDPNYKENCDYYNAIMRSNAYHIAYVSETQVHISENTVTILPKAPIADSLTDMVVWDVTVKFQQYGTPCPTDIPPGIFTCFALVP